MYINIYNAWHTYKQCMYVHIYSVCTYIYTVYVHTCMTDGMTVEKPHIQSCPEHVHVSYTHTHVYTHNIALRIRGLDDQLLSFVLLTRGVVIVPLHSKAA